MDLISSQLTRTQMRLVTRLFTASKRYKGTPTIAVKSDTECLQAELLVKKHPDKFSFRYDKSGNIVLMADRNSLFEQTLLV